MMNIKKTLLFVLTLFVIGCQSETKDPIVEFQQSLINDGKTGSNVFMVYKDGWELLTRGFIWALR